MKTWMVCLLLASANIAQAQIPYVIQKAADAGDADAQASIGVSYIEGDGGVTKDYSKALGEKGRKRGQA